MLPPIRQIAPGKKIFFASDFHLGIPDHTASAERERKVVRWLDSIKEEAAAIFLLGDMFDFWFEYKYTIPKGFIRLQGKLAEITDRGIPVFFFSGNHDMWMFDYFTKELNIQVFHKPEETEIAGKKFLLGHGDGLGPGDKGFKILKKIFRNRTCQWLFGFIHPNIGMAFANYWSKSSRKHKKEEPFIGDQEWIYAYCKETERKKHFDYYIFGHRHMPLDLKVNEHSRYINLGEWMHHYTYAVFDGNSLDLKKFED